MYLESCSAAAECWRVRRVIRRILLGVTLLGTLVLGGTNCEEPTGPCLGPNRVCSRHEQCCSEFCNFWPHSDPLMGLCL